MGVDCISEKLKNFFEGFVVGKNGQKCQKFSLLVPLLKFTESVDQYLMHVNFSESSNFHQLFRFFNWLPPPPIFPTRDIIRYIGPIKLVLSAMLGTIRHILKIEKTDLDFWPEFRGEIFREIFRNRQWINFQW